MLAPDVRVEFRAGVEVVRSELLVDERVMLVAELDEALDEAVLEAEPSRPWAAARIVALNWPVILSSGKRAEKDMYGMFFESSLVDSIRMKLADATSGQRRHAEERREHASGDTARRRAKRSCAAAGHTPDAAHGLLSPREGPVPSIANDCAPDA